MMMIMMMMMITMMIMMMMMMMMMTIVMMLMMTMMMRMVMRNVMTMMAMTTTTTMVKTMTMIMMTILMAMNFILKCQDFSCFSCRHGCCSFADLTVVCGGCTLSLRSAQLLLISAKRQRRGHNVYYVMLPN